MQFNEGRMATTLEESLLVVKSWEVGTGMGWVCRRCQRGSVGRVCGRCQGLWGSGWSGYVRGLECGGCRGNREWTGLERGVEVDVDWRIGGLVWTLSALWLLCEAQGTGIMEQGGVEDDPSRVSPSSKVTGSSTGSLRSKLANANSTLLSKPISSGKTSHIFVFPFNHSSLCL
jgi:hypothetical protein